MRVLVLGGTKFLGRAIVEDALARGHELTLFNRGETNPELFPQVERLRGDRDGGLAALDGRRFDAAVDTSGYVPRVVAQSAELLSQTVGHYVFVSSVSVYADYAQPVHEEWPLATVEDETTEDVKEHYGALKALCERVAGEAFPGRALALRAGLIVGPHDPTGRFTYWPHRIARGGEVLVPGPPERQVQFVDVRDVARFVVDACERGLAGPFNVTGPPLTLSELVETCRRVARSDASFTWVDDAFLVEHGVGEWLELPLWLAPAEESAHFMDVSVTKALDCGLRLRPLEETVRATLAEAEPVAGAGLSPQREAELLRAWHGRV